MSIPSAEFHRDDNHSRRARKMSSNVLPGIAYTISDFFDNSEFNMVYVQAIQDSEIKMRQKYLELMEKANPKLSKDDLFKLKKDKRELKNKIRDQDKKRVDLMNRDPERFRLLKVMSNLRKLKT